MSKTVKGVIFTLIGAICWGFCGSCGDVLFKQKGFSADWVSCVRLLSAGLILVILSVLKEKKKAFDIFKKPKSIWMLVAFGIFGLMVSQFTYLTTINYSNSGTATILQYTGLAMILVVVCVMEKRLPKIFETLALVFAMGGIFLIATHGDIKTMVISKECLFWGLFSAVGLVCYYMIPKKLLKEYGAITASGFGMIIGGVVLCLIIRPWQYAVSFDFGAVLALLGVIIIGTVVAYNLYLMGVNLIGPVKAGMIAAIEPVAAAVFSFLFVGTSFTFWDVIGFAFIISTVFISNIKKELS